MTKPVEHDTIPPLILDDDDSDDDMDTRKFFLSLSDALILFELEIYSLRMRIRHLIEPQAIYNNNKVN